MNYPIKIEELAKDDHGNPLVCSGCAHSAGSEPFPGQPSGERPCCFCTRNVQREQWIIDNIRTGCTNMGPDAYGKTWTAFYDNSPMKKCPMDCYISTDRVMNGVPEGAHIIT